MSRKTPRYLSWEEWEMIKAYRAAVACAAKVPHSDKLHALAAAKRSMQDGAPFKINVYQCPICQKWHLTKCEGPYIDKP